MNFAGLMKKRPKSTAAMNMTMIRNVWRPPEMTGPAFEEGSAGRGSTKGMTSGSAVYAMTQMNAIGLKGFQLIKSTCQKVATKITVRKAMVPHDIQRKRDQSGSRHIRKPSKQRKAKQVPMNMALSGLPMGHAKNWA